MTPPSAESNALRYISAAEMAFVRHIPSDGRLIPNLTFHDGRGFELYIPQRDGSLMVTRPLDMLGGHYIAGDAAFPVDVPDPFWEIAIRHFTFRPMLEVLGGLHADLVNALGSIHRYFFLLSYADSYSDRADTTLMASDLEYAFGNHRAFYDLANRVLDLFRVEPQFTAATFPKSFRRAVQKSDEQLKQKYGVTDDFLAFMRERQSHFLLMRSIRDGIFHHGEVPVDVIYRFDDGFGVATDSELVAKLQELQLWTPETVRNGVIVPLLPLLAFIADDIWNGLSDLALRMRRIYGCPESLIGDLRVYFRSPLAGHIVRLREYRTKQWLPAEQVLTGNRTSGAG